MIINFKAVVYKEYIEIRFNEKFSLLKKKINRLKL